MLILGVLDGIPHKCVFDADFLESVLDKSVELETQIYRFLCATLQLEWLSTLISSGLLPMQRSQGQSLITGVYCTVYHSFCFFLYYPCVIQYSHLLYLSLNLYHPFILSISQLSFFTLLLLLLLLYIQPAGTYSDDCLLFNDLPCSKCVDSQHPNGHLR